MMLPYLHQRRVYLNRIKPNTHYFYTSIDTTFEEERKFNLCLNNHHSLYKLATGKISWELEQVLMSQEQ